MIPEKRSLEIQRCADYVDEVVVEYCSKWGVGQLEKLCTVQLRDKFYAHKEKFNKAILENNINHAEQLAHGFKRAYAALEASALENGYNPPEAKFIACEAKNGEMVYVANTLKDAAKLQAMLRGKPGRIFTMQEVANLAVSNWCIVHREKVKQADKAAISQASDPFDFEKGDPLPDGF